MQDARKLHIRLTPRAESQIAMPQAQHTTLQAAQQAAQAQVAALHHQQQHQQPGQGAQHVDGRLGMLLCRVVLGRIAQGTGGLRRPPTGADSVTQLVR